MKIGMYTDDEILEHLTDGEGRGFLGRSMYDAIIEIINKKEAMYDSLAVDYRLAQEEIERQKEIIKQLDIKNLELTTIIKEAINYIDDNTYYKDHKGHINIDDLYIILQGSDKE